ncbi:hypothetical protein HZY62_18370 [Maribacter polysiphoniae]|uniref:Uncharacterized protein n=1 Tax=Maribacter polysiphoniae TaxID=429344 RepID=A0A316DT58_9FLAO|nr:DUF6624 domain-containing protein [Maribacter polysiphoniae]MBD1262569.1 hypothetical protein [Maribacter polysiphoniae]PWK21234.1 hypothetical protein LX92_04035 [Maribacter polysiphoniae]
MKQAILIIIILSISFSALGQSQKEFDSLKVKLGTIFMKDQTFRRIYIEAENKLGKDSDAYEYFWEVVETQDKILEKEVTRIIDEYGWLGISQVGRLANGTLWSVLQHGSVASKKKYAPLLKASVLKEESQPSHYARLIDRMLINSGKPQLYGTQINYQSSNVPTFFPIEQPEYVNQRRKEIGLEEIQSFAKERGLEWNITQKEK